MEQIFSRELLTLPEELHTSRLQLRPLQPGDIDTLWEMDSDPEVMRFVFPPATDRKAHHEETLRDMEAGRRFKFFRAICRPDQERIDGWVFMRPTDDGQWLELGYRLRQGAWGQGLVPEAARVMMTHAEAHWAKNRFIALILSENENSKRAAAKMGLSFKEITDRYYDETAELWVG